ncbi:MAG: hypothetical protein D3923_19270, partial [Candidatus Electrothrix sp. AR3]|nr:hypothetical protein [Candidatus Electrothrix sp. AR3]
VWGVGDVLNANSSSEDATSWELAEKGFWRKDPYLALQESFYYPEEQVSLNQHLIVEETGEMEVYRFWVHTFSHADLEKMLLTAGFRTNECFEQVLPHSALYSSDAVTFCLAIK